MSRRNAKPKKQVTPVLPQGLFGVHAPTWAQIKKTLEAQPEGWRVELADRLNVRPSAITMMMQREGQPSYQRVCDVLAWMQERGLNVE